MIDTKAIRSKILDLAIQGKLTDNISTSDASVVIPLIEEKYHILLANNETKQRPEESMIQDDLFELPSTWGWFPLYKLCIFLSRGKSPTYSDVKRYPVFAQKCNQPTGLELHRALFLDESTLNKWQLFYHLTDGDILINSTGTGTMGRVGYYDNALLDSEYPFIVPDSHITVVRLGEEIDSKYVYHALRSPFLQKIMEHQFRGTTNQKEFYIKSVAAIPIPLPPLAEQKRIVERIEQVFSVLDEIDELQSRYTDNLAALKSKLIDAAIQGKLTEQLPEDGTAEELYQQIQKEKQELIKAGKIKKEKLLPEITEDEIPFEIPMNWKWVRLGDYMDVRDGTHESPEFYAEGYPLVTSKNLKNGEVDLSNVKYISKADYDSINLRSRVDEGDILFAMIGSIGNPAIVGKEHVYAIKNVALFKKIIPECNEYYIYYYFYLVQFTMREKARGGLQPFVSLSYLRRYLFPLPPLSEQRRIVECLDELLALCCG